jgi:hypothetical protein
MRLRPALVATLAVFIGLSAPVAAVDGDKAQYVGGTLTLKAKSEVSTTTTTLFLNVKNEQPLAVLELRSKKEIEYQDDEARQSLGGGKK